MATVKIAFSISILAVFGLVFVQSATSPMPAASTTATPAMAASTVVAATAATTKAATVGAATTAAATTAAATTAAAATTGSASTARNTLIMIGGQLVEALDKCTVGDSSTCPSGHCCTKKDLVYTANYPGPRPAYVLECKPLKRTGENCYYRPSAEFCPCASTCRSNGFFGHCL